MDDNIRDADDAWATTTIAQCCGVPATPAELHSMDMGSQNPTCLWTSSTLSSVHPHVDPPTILRLRSLKCLCFAGLLGGALATLIVLGVLGARARNRPPVESMAPSTDDAVPITGLLELGDSCGVDQGVHRGWCAAELMCYGFTCKRCPCLPGVGCGKGSDTESRPVVKCDVDPCDGLLCEHGFCIKSKVIGSCVCMPSYSGSRCEIYNPCAQINCGHHRHCVNSSTNPQIIYHCEDDPDPSPSPEPTEPGAAGSNCADGDWKCSIWAQTGECEKDAVFMLSKCRKECGACSDSDNADKGTGTKSAELESGII
jgi:hypothetical protein